MNPQTKLYVEAIFRRTYQHHGLQGKRFGKSPRGGACSYKEGCAIGISLPEELRSTIQNDGVVIHLRENEAVKRALLGNNPPELLDKETIYLLGQLQGLHDDCAPKNDHLGYARKVENLCASYGLELTPQPLEVFRGAA